MARLRDPFARPETLGPTRVRTLKDLLGPEDRFEIMGPGGQVDRAATEELLNRPQGPSAQVGGMTLFSPSRALYPEGLRALMEFARRDRERASAIEELKRREAESRTIRERELITQAMVGNPNAIAELQRRKGAIAERESAELGREVAPGLSLGTLLKAGTSLSKLDPDSQRALFEKLIPGLPKGRSRLEKIEEEARIKARVRKEEKQLTPQEEAFARLSPEEQRGVTLREKPEQPLTPKDKQVVANQIIAEARRQTEAQFRGVLGQLDLSSLGKTPQERRQKFRGMVNQTAKELAEERGFDFEELRGAKKKVQPLVERLTAKQAQSELNEAIAQGEILDTAAAEQFLIDRGVPRSNARYIVNQLKQGE